MEITWEFYKQECDIAFLPFKTKFVTQVFIRDMQGKGWKYLYAFNSVWICILFSASVKECIKN